MPPDHLDNHRERIRGPYAADMTRVASGAVHPHKSVIVVVSRASKIREPLSQLAIPSR